MILILGGAYQGKRSYAQEKFHLKDEEVYTCQGTEIDFSKPCIAKLEEFVYACVQEQKDALSYFRDHEAQWENSILICQDLFCGVVPLGADLRAWRQNTGLLCQYLAKRAESVTRIYCGLEQKLK